jgi:hypothetical protein
MASTTMGIGLAQLGEDRPSSNPYLSFEGTLLNVAGKKTSWNFG